MKRTISFLLTLLCVSVNAQTSRDLDRSEIIDIFRILTEQPRKTWIASGTIQANHEEYKAPKVTDEDEITTRIAQETQVYRDNPNKRELTEKLQRMRLEAMPYNVRYKLSKEYVMNSDELVRYDGERFYWEINVNTRIDSLERPLDMADNFLIREFKLDWNQRRVFAWDGQKYVLYFRPGNYAMIEDSPSGINGPLTAGIIPWGYGRYSYENLINTEFLASEVESDGELEIHLAIIDGDISETFVLDPLNNYVVKQYTETVSNVYYRVSDYSNYELFNDNLCPGNIIIQQYDISTGSARLLSEDTWDFTFVETGELDTESFVVDYEYDALIEDLRFDEKMQFRYSPPEGPSLQAVNTQELLQDRLEIVSLPENYNQNCATVSLKYACNKFGLRPSWEDLCRLVKGTEKTTSLLEMQKFIDGLGLNSIAVSTDLETLKLTNNSEVILHLPEINHYVVLGNIDDKYVRLIDLDKNKFYYRRSIENFNKTWKGTALIIEDTLIKTANSFAKIDGNLLSEIIGAASCQICDDPAQKEIIFDECDTQYGACGGQESKYHERWKCVPAQSGNCTEDLLPWYTETVCEKNLYDQCLPEGDFLVYIDADACY